MNKRGRHRYLRRAVNTVIRGDCRKVLRNLPDNSIHYVIGDPPYALHFMGKAWDKFPTHTGLRKPFAQRSREYEYGKLPFQKWVEGVARECLRVLRPGGYLMLMGGTRTFHRLASGIEDAGFEIRDTFTWHHGQGFNKGSNIGKAIDRKAGKKRKVVKAGKGKGRGGQLTAVFSSNVGINTPEFIKKQGEVTEPATELAAKWEGWNTNVKPATEFFVIARKPLSEKTVVENVLRWGTGAINMEGCRKGKGKVQVNVLEKASPHGQAKRLGYKKKISSGRLPSNLGLEHTEFCKRVGKKVERAQIGATGGKQDRKGWSGGWNQDGTVRPENKKINIEYERWTCHPQCPVRLLDEQSIAGGMHGAGSSRFNQRDTSGVGRGMFPLHGKGGHRFGDKGGASRFFYTAKAAGKEKWFLCKVCDVVQDGSRKKEHRKHEIHCLTCEKNGTWKKHRKHKTKPNLIGHPTQKPEKLMRWLIRMHTVRGGLVLDPFLGSGTVAVAAMKEGMRFVGVDKDKTFVRIARKRIRSERIPTPVEVVHG